MTHPAQRLNNAVHQRTRLGILTVLATSTRADFVSLRTTLDLTDGSLSRNLTTLEQAGYLLIEKTFEGRRPRTWITITPTGSQALREEIAALQEIVASVEQARSARLRTAPRSRPALA